jgi:hypothetical protein
VMRRASVEVSPVCVVFFLGQLLSIAAEELSQTTGSASSTGSTSSFSALALVMAGIKSTFCKCSNEVGCMDGSASLKNC